MSFRFDLRPLFLNDPGWHAPIYDAMDPVAALPSGLHHGGRRLIIPVVFEDEPAFQDGLARLLVAAAGPPIEHPKPGTLLRQIEKKAIVLSPETIDDYIQVRYQRWNRLMRLSQPPRKLDNWLRLIGDRDVYVHARIPLGIVLVPPYPEDLGFITHKGYFPYPVGAGTVAKETVVAYRLRPPDATGWE